MKEKIIRIIEIKIMIDYLEKTDKEKKELMNSGSYAIAEGYMTKNMKLIEELEKELSEIKLNY